MPPESHDLKSEAAPYFPEDERTTRPLIVTGLYLLFVFGIGLLIAPWVYWGVQEMGGAVPAGRVWRNIPSTVTSPVA